MLNLATALVAVGALYFLLTERVLPLLQSEPVRVHEGGTLTESFAFRPLGVEKPKAAEEETKDWDFSAKYEARREVRKALEDKVSGMG